MEITVINSIDKLPVSLQGFAKARIGQKAIKDLTPIQIAKVCEEVIVRAFAEAGQIGITQEILLFQKQTLIDELKGKFGVLTPDEVKEAFRLGIRGESGSYFGLCAKTYHQFLKYYFELPQRAETMKAFLSITNEAALLSKEPTPEQKEQIMKEAAIISFNEYKSERKLPFVCQPIYDFLWKKGFINWTESEKNDIVAYVKEKYKSELLDQKTKGEISHRDFKNIVENLGGDKNRRLINKVKTEGLKRYFELLIKNNETIEF